MTIRPAVAAFDPLQHQQPDRRVNGSSTSTVPTGSRRGPRTRPAPTRVRRDASGVPEVTSPASTGMHRCRPRRRDADATATGDRFSDSRACSSSDSPHKLALAAANGHCAQFRRIRFGSRRVRPVLGRHLSAVWAHGIARVLAAARRGCGVVVRARLSARALGEAMSASPPLDSSVAVGRRLPCPATSPGARRATRGAGTRLTRRAPRRSSRSCAAAATGCTATAPAG